MRKGRAEALLAPLASSVAGTLSDGRLRGSFQGHGVEAWPDKHQPSRTRLLARGAVVALVPNSGARRSRRSQTCDVTGAGIGPPIATLRLHEPHSRGSASRRSDAPGH
jgi:hypothetical protein